MKNGSKTRFSARRTVYRLRRTVRRKRRKARQVRFHDVSEAVKHQPIERREMKTGPIPRADGDFLLWHDKLLANAASLGTTLVITTEDIASQDPPHKSAEELPAAPGRDVGH